MKKDISSNLPNDHSFYIESNSGKSNIAFSGIDTFYLERYNVISGFKESNPFPFIIFDFKEKDITIANSRHNFKINRDTALDPSFSLTQKDLEKKIKIKFGTVGVLNNTYISDVVNITYKTGNLNLDVRPRVNGSGVLLQGEVGEVPESVVLVSGNQTISGNKNFISGIDAPNIVYNTGNQIISGNKIFVDDLQISGNFILNDIDTLNLSGVNLNLANSSIDLGNSQLLNFLPKIIGVSTTSTSISGDAYNGKTILYNNNSLGIFTIYTGNNIGFYTSLIQVGNGQASITGSNAVRINSYNNQYKTAGKYAKISFFHTGNDGYIVEGNTTN
jgi:hypothetical protein